ncbi:MAG: bifunctional nuclease family protein [Deltaproteobacteria bacterium]|nr:bifunctional nuclease family protein [Deltaproteobacteria bacterium]
MIVQGLTIDPGSNSPILILKNPEGEERLPIWIGLMEATAIASELEKVSFSRPMTHDLMKNLIGNLGYTISKIEVTELKDNTFYALLHLLGPGGSLTVDSRPSDAIALALRTNAPIYVARAVLEETVEGEGHVGESDNKWKEVLDKMDPDDFGKYKM